MELESKRLLLRKYTALDIDEAYQVNLDPEMSRYTGDGGVQSRDEIAHIIKNVVISDYHNIGYGRLAAIHKTDQAYIGFAGLKYVEEHDEVDLGYRFAQKYWGQGLATEAGWACLNYGFHRLDLEEVTAMVMSVNKASIRVLEKLGFQLYNTILEDNQPIEVYRLSRERFRAREKNLRTKFGKVLFS